MDTPHTWHPRGLRRVRRVGPKPGRSLVRHFDGHAGRPRPPAGDLRPPPHLFVHRGAVVRAGDLRPRAVRREGPRLGLTRMTTGTGRLPHRGPPAPRPV